MTGFSPTACEKPDGGAPDGKIFDGAVADGQAQLSERLIQSVPHGVSGQRVVELPQFPCGSHQDRAAVGGIYGDETVHFSLLVVGSHPGHGVAGPAPPQQSSHAVPHHISLTHGNFFPPPVLA